MIQQLISTSSPRCLNGNAGFGIVAQTVGMAPNVSQVVNALSGYSHRFSAGDARNPLVFLHTLRRTGGVLRHIVSRVSDSGNDYSGRTNRLAHHWIIEQNDVRQLPCGPATLATRNIFTTAWSGQSKELPFTPAPFGSEIPVSIGICTAWRQLTGDAGWAGVVAERIEKGNPISIIFAVSQKDMPLHLLNEALALLPEHVRWQTTFSTFFMKSQEPAGAGREEKIQVKFFLDGTDEARYAKQTPDTLLIDLRNPQSLGQVPTTTKYVEAARTGKSVTEPAAQKLQRQTAKQVSTPVPKEYHGPTFDGIYGTEPGNGLELVVDVPKMSRGLTEAERAKTHKPKRRENINPLYWIVPIALLLVVLIGLTVWLFMGKSAMEIAKAEKEQKQTELMEQEAKEKKDKEEKDKEEADKKVTEEKAEKDRKDKEEADKKAAEEKVEKDKKDKEETDKKTTEEKAEKDKKDKEEADKKAAAERMRQKLPEKIRAVLPSVWGGLALPAKNENIEPWDLSKLLELEGVKSGDVKISYVPLVKLEETKEGSTARPLEFQQEGSSIVFNLLDQKDPAHAKREKIATIYCKNNAYRFKWESDLLREKYNSNDWKRILNRILFAKLKITVSPEGMTPVSKEIALWQPVENPTTYTEMKIPTEEGKAFALWQRPDSKSMSQGTAPEKQFVFYKEDNVSLLLSFDKLQADGKEVAIKKGIQPFAGFSSAGDLIKVNGFSPVFSYPAEHTPLLIAITYTDLKFEFKILPEEEKIKEKFINPRQEKKDGNDEIIRKINDLESRKQEFQNEKDDNKKSTLVAEINRLNNEIGNKTKNDLEKSNKKLEIEKNEIENDLKTAQKAVYSVPIFSISLLKSGTKQEDATKQENRLLLLEVK